MALTFVKLALLLGTCHHVLAGHHSLPCKTTTTISAPVVTIPVVSYTFTTTTSLIPITAPAETVRETTTTTVFSATEISCLSSATTLPPRPSTVPRDTTSRDVTDIEDRGLLGLPILEPIKDLLCPKPPHFPDMPSIPCFTFVNPIEYSTTTSTIAITVPQTTLITPAPTTTTVTQTDVLPTPATYSGLNYYQYTNNYMYNGQNSAGYGGGGYDTFDWVNNTNYEFDGLTTTVDFENPGWPSFENLNIQLPGMPAPRDASQWTVLFQGFLHAREGGDWTITYSDPPIDNAGYTWVGPKAYRFFTNENNDIDYTEFSTTPPESAGFRFVVGEFVPVTVIVANGGGPMRHRLSAISPGGTPFPGLEGIFVPPCPGGQFIP